MVNVRAFLSAMKLSWIRRLKLDSSFKTFMVNMYPELDNIQLFGSEYINVVKQNIHNPFWRDVVHFKLLFSKYNNTKEDEFYAEHIQYNSNIVRGKNLFI
jgi:hypothetical protein